MMIALLALLFIAPALTGHGLVLAASALAVLTLGWSQGGRIASGSKKAAVMFTLALFALWLLNAWAWQVWL